MKAEVKYRNLEFKQASGTSRGVLRTKESWFLELQDEGKRGTGECSVIKGLSPDYSQDIEDRMQTLQVLINEGNSPNLYDAFFNGVPAVQFCYEMALKELDHDTKGKLYDTDFLRGAGIPINGLVWMGSKSFMQEQITSKINEGYRCIKIKIAAIDFEEECELIKGIRKEFPRADIEIRVDANGGFSTEQAIEKLKRLSDFDLHSIEQPIAQGLAEAMAELCERSPLDIALDEELIGVTKDKAQISLLDTIKPQYIILKPSLLGGFAASESWINKANDRSIGWWVTSALEANVGLNAIAQWSTTLNATGYQGLGTGQLFSNNIDSPLYIDSGKLYYGDSEWAEI